eukprot:15364459-Ditylum_brightwellii.AAC.1
MAVGFYLPPPKQIGENFLLGIDMTIGHSQKGHPEEKGPILLQQQMTRFSARACNYITAYRHLHMESQPKLKEKAASPHSTLVTTLKMKNIEQMKHTHMFHHRVERCRTGYCTITALAIMRCIAVKSEERCQWI